MRSWRQPLGCIAIWLLVGFLIILLSGACAYLLGGEDRGPGTLRWEAPDWWPFKSEVVHPTPLPDSSGGAAVQPIVGAFYYLYYGRPGQWGAGHGETPVLGEYDVTEPDVLAQHVRWAKQAGIDFLSTSWNPRDADGGDTFIDDAFDQYLALEDPIPNSITYEGKMALNPQPDWVAIDFDALYDGGPDTIGDRFVSDMNLLISRGWLGHDSYYKIDGRPVVYLWNYFLFRNYGAYFDQVEANFANAGLVAPYWIAHVEAWDNPENAAFDWTQARGRVQAVNSPLMYVNDDRMDTYYDLVLDKWTQWKNTAESFGIRFVPHVLPGYNDRVTTGDPTRRIIARDNGSTLRKHWTLAKETMASDLPMVMVQSFNEWFEGHEMEPSTQYGTLYLDLNAELKQVSTSLWAGVSHLTSIIGVLNPTELGFDDQIELDEWLTSLIAEAQAHVTTYIRQDFTAITVPADVRGVMLRAAANAYSHALVTRRGPLVQTGEFDIRIVDSQILTPTLKRELREYRQVPLGVPR